MTLSTHWSVIEQLRGREASEAWRWFIDRYRAFVAAALRRLIWSSNRADAACEEFWGYLFQTGAVDRASRSACFRAFLCATIRNYARDWMRRNPRVPDTADRAEGVADAVLPEDTEVALWARQLLHLALERLEQEQPRQARVLRSFYGLPATMDGDPPPRRRATELAAELGCAPNALHQMLFRARRNLHAGVVDEVRQTVRERCDLKSELDLLLAKIGREAPGLLAAPCDEEGDT